MINQFLTVDELAEEWRVKKSWVYARTRETGKNAIPRIKVGKYLRFIPDEVDAWLERNGRNERN